jgi:hypothetical protein
MDKQLIPGICCTVEIDQAAYKTSAGHQIKGRVVSPSVPREENGTYWGQTVCMASTITAVMDECPFESKCGYYFKD